MFGKVPGGIPGGKSRNHPGLGDKSLVLCWEETGEKLGITGEKLGIRGEDGDKGKSGNREKKNLGIKGKLGTGRINGRFLLGMPREAPEWFWGLGIREFPDFPGSGGRKKPGKCGEGRKRKRPGNGSFPGKLFQGFSFPNPASLPLPIPGPCPWKIPGSRGRLEFPAHN